ncbi:hypothetical protein ACJ73_07906, partial [Blastomyces percursus]
MRRSMYMYNPGGFGMSLQQDVAIKRRNWKGVFRKADSATSAAAINPVASN